jgi:DMSO/TMAO reductase YedYZ molybdopterin-dependent catalytic subunit
MLVIMPLTSAGVFASELVDGTWPAILGYFAVCLVFAAALIVVRVMLELSSPETYLSRPQPARRAVVVALGSALVALVSTYVLELAPPRASVTPLRVRDPQEPVPTGGYAPPQPDPDRVNAPGSGAPEAGSPPATPISDSETTLAFADPRPARPLKRDKDGAVLPSGRRKGELTDLITSNDDFYVITKNAGGDPILGARTWRLRIDGLVERSIELDYPSFRNLPSVDVTKTLECISNFVAKCDLATYGCDLISTARWRGVRLADVLELAGGAKAEATHLAVISADEYTSALPIELALDPDALLVYEMNGEVLPREHGYPARLLVPGRYGMKNPKWVVALRPMRGEFVDWYGQRNWSKEGRVQTMTRIDVPTPGATLLPGDYNIAGVAYAGDRGLGKVEYSTDSGQRWQQAELLEAPAGNDSWVRWIGRFTLRPGTQTTLVSRATDSSGIVQVKDFSLPEPDGSAGWNAVEVRAAPV